MILYVILIIPLITLVNGDENVSNCTLYNYCGSHGYCYNVTEDQWFCDCKFWWEGRLCNKQSDSGKQVIVLGSITGFLLFLFYGLKIGRKVYMKKKYPKIEIEEVSKEPMTPIISLDHVKKTLTLTSYIIIILTILVAVGTLVAKWSILHNIHKIVVSQYLNKSELIYYNRSSICDILDREDFSVFTFPCACLLVILCVVVTKRSSFMKRIFYGYGAPPIPIDFLSHVDRTFSAVIFAIIASDLLEIVQNAVSGTGNDKSSGILVTFILRILAVLYMGLQYYPILAAVYLNSVFILACATLYTWLVFAFSIISLNMCYPDYYPTYYDALDDPDDIIRKLNYYGTGSRLLAIQVCAAIPTYLCFAYISVKVPTMLVQKILSYHKTGLSVDKQMLLPLSREETILLRISRPGSPELLYVQNLFRSPEQRPRSRSIFARIIPKFIYEWRDDFRFSSRVLCIYSSIFLLLFLVIIWASVTFIPYVRGTQKDIQDTVNDIVNAFIDDSENLPESSFELPDLVRPFLLGTALAVTVIVIQLLVLLANIRRNLIQVFRGDCSEIPRRNRANYVSYATGNFHFAGYFIGYLIWACLILVVVCIVICTAIDAFVVFGSVRIVEIILKAIIPSLLLVLFKIYLNKCLAQYVFLQHCGDVLALNNRRNLMIFIFFNFFLDAFLGFISSILRFVKSIVATIIYMCRLDYSALGRKLEMFDSGFGAYCGFIHTECTHRHPVMLVFVSYLFNQIRREEYIMKNVVPSNDIPIQEKDPNRQKRSLRWIRKWRLAFFLIRNPTVLIFRKSFLKQLPPASRRALTDTDNHNEYSMQRKLVMFDFQKAAQQSNFGLQPRISDSIYVRL